MEKIHPDAVVYEFPFTIHPVGANHRQELVNILLSLTRSPKRFRTITFEDQVVVDIFTTPEGAINIARDLEIGDDESYGLPLDK